MSRFCKNSELLDSGKAYIASIPDSYMFSKKKTNRRHYYVVYKDLDSGIVRAVGTTHLYKYDAHGLAFSSKPYYGGEFKFSQFKLPSGVSCYYRDKNTSDEPIDIDDSCISFLDSVPLSLSNFSAVKSVASVSYEEWKDNLKKNVKKAP